MHTCLGRMACTPHSSGDLGMSLSVICKSALVGCMYVCVSWSQCVYVFYTHTCMQAFICIHVHACICIHMHAYICTGVLWCNIHKRGVPSHNPHTHTHIHTHLHTSSHNPNTHTHTHLHRLSHSPAASASSATFTFKAGFSQSTQTHTHTYTHLHRYTPWHRSPQQPQPAEQGSHMRRAF
jgi:hypothetical protein